MTEQEKQMQKDICSEKVNFINQRLETKYPLERLDETAIKRVRETDDYIAYEYTDPNNRNEVIDICVIKKDGVVVHRIFSKRKRAISERYWYLPIILLLVEICTITVRLLLL